MDAVKIGEFLMKLRKEKGMTQSQLGEKIGVTNKTVSRWENGNYLPSVDMLKALSEEYDVTINEILNGERVKNEDYKKVAEENIRDVLKSCAFTLDEKIRYWKKRWYKNNLFSIIIFALIFLLLLTYSQIKSNIEWVIVSEAYGFVGIIIFHNRKMAYVEKKAYESDDNIT